jgi:hypothetical protein
MGMTPNDRQDGRLADHSAAVLAEVNDVAARAAHEIMAQIEFGVPTEELCTLIVRNACLEVIVSANSAQPVIV